MPPPRLSLPLALLAWYRSRDWPRIGLGTLLEGIVIGLLVSLALAYSLA